MASTVTAVVALAASPAPRTLARSLQAPLPRRRRNDAVSFVARPAARANRRRLVLAVAAADPSDNDLGTKVSESIKQAQETCADDPASGECVAAWDEVEELSAAASHARDRRKGADPLEEFCQDNPETDECRTYED